MDLQIVHLDWVGPGIGAGFSLYTPVFKKRYEDKEWFRCISLIVHLMGFQLCLTIPLWVEGVDAEERGGG